LPVMVNSPPPTSCDNRQFSWRMNASSACNTHKVREFMAGRMNPEVVGGDDKDMN
jgi:hypothetical protein